MSVIPKIRFKEFTDAWEQRKLGEVANYRRGSFPQPYGKSEWYDGEGAMPFVQVADVSDEMNLVEDTKQKISKLAQPMSVLADKNSVLVTLQGSIGRVAITQYEAFIDRTVLIFEKYNIDIDNVFWAYIIKQKFIEEARKAPGGTIKTITKEALSDFDLSIPNYQEQKQIGVFLRNLDRLITLHQRKCDETKDLKKYMLQKMFPKKGEKVPEIRFEGFTADWEQRKLSEIALQTYGGGTPKTTNEEFWKGNIPWIQSSDLIEERLFNVKPRKYISQDAISKSSTKLVPQNSIAIVTRVGVGKLAFMPFSYATSQDFLSLSELKIEPEFAVYALCKMMRLVSNEVQGTSIKGITKDELLAKEILIPDCEEQKKIGAYLHNLDNLITLHQRKCDSLKELKKFMLQNMFPKEK